MQRKPTSNFGSEIISFHEIQTWTHLHWNFITYIPQKGIQSNLKPIFSDDTRGNYINQIYILFYEIHKMQLKYFMRIFKKLNNLKMYPGLRKRKWLREILLGQKSSHLSGMLVFFQIATTSMIVFFALNFMVVPIFTCECIKRRKTSLVEGQLYYLLQRTSN